MLAHQELESLCLDRETYHYKQYVALRYAELVYYGQWFTPLREALDGFIEVTQRNVSGEVRLGLCKGNLRVLDRQSPNSLYDVSIGSFVMSRDYNQKDAEGFIKILGLPLRLAAEKKAAATATRRARRG
jgi:argininosuccinate synthase